MPTPPSQPAASPAAGGAGESESVEDFWQTEPGGDQYKGSRNDKGQAHGAGMLRFKSGEFYDGEFINDKMDGHGKHTWPSGARYVGNWENDERHGFGSYTYPDGAVYEGRFKKSMRDGAKGTYTWKNGEVYIGGFKSDKLEGRGTFLWCSGRIDLITYSKGKATGDGVRWSVDRQKAWRLKNGEEVGEMDLEEANASLKQHEEEMDDKLTVETAEAAKKAADRAEKLAKMNKKKKGSST